MAKTHGGKRPGSGRPKKEVKKKENHISTSVTDEAFSIYKEKNKKGEFVSKAIINQSRADKAKQDKKDKAKLKDDGK